MKIIIRVDTNDADFVDKISDITQVQLAEIRPLIERIKNFEPYQGVNQRFRHHHNYPTGEMLRDDLGEKSPSELYPDIDEDVFELFEELLPDCEFGFHTIESIEILPDSDVEKLL